MVLPMSRMSAARRYRLTRTLLVAAFVAALAVGYLTAGWNWYG